MVSSDPNLRGIGLTGTSNGNPVTRLSEKSVHVGQTRRLPYRLFNPLEEAYLPGAGREGTSSESP